LSVPEKVLSRQWRGVLREYADRLDVSDATPIVTLGEGGTPLIPAEALSRRTGAQVYVKFEGMNPTGSFKDRGMTMAISKAVEHGAKAVICASTGNTSASAAAYAAHAGIQAVVLVPEGKIAMGKLSQAIAHNAQLLQVQGNFDDCLDIARELANNYPVHLVNSVNPDRIEGQKTAAFEVVEVLGNAPDFHYIPVGNAGNYTAYHRGYNEELQRGATSKLPRMFGFQAAGSAPIVLGHPVKDPDTIASAIRIGNPASWELALAARDHSNGYFGAIDDSKILEAHRILSAEVGIFVEPASAISIAGLLERAAAGAVPAGATIVATVTGHGLKDPQWALRTADGSDVQPTSVPIDVAQIADVLGLKRASADDSAANGSEVNDAGASSAAIGGAEQPPGSGA
jgi:threonine synthase